MKRLLAALIILLALFLGGGAFYLQIQLKRQQSQLTELKDELAALQLASYNQTAVLDRLEEEYRKLADDPPDGVPDDLARLLRDELTKISQAAARQRRTQAFAHAKMVLEGHGDAAAAVTALAECDETDPEVQALRGR